MSPGKDIETPSKDSNVKPTETRPADGKEDVEKRASRGEEGLASSEDEHYAKDWHRLIHMKRKERRQRKEEEVHKERPQQQRMERMEQEKQGGRKQRHHQHEAEYQSLEEYIRALEERHAREGTRPTQDELDLQDSLCTAEHRRWRVESELGERLDALESRLCRAEEERLEAEKTYTEKMKRRQQEEEQTRGRTGGIPCLKPPRLRVVSESPTSESPSDESEEDDVDEDSRREERGRSHRRYSSRPEERGRARGSRIPGQTPPRLRVVSQSPPSRSPSPSPPRSHSAHSVHDTLRPEPRRSTHVHHPPLPREKIILVQPSASPSRHPDARRPRTPPRSLSPRRPRPRLRSISPRRYQSRSSTLIESPPRRRCSATPHRPPPPSRSATYVNVHERRRRSTTPPRRRRSEPGRSSHIYLVRHHRDPRRPTIWVRDSSR